MLSDVDFLRKSSDRHRFGRLFQILLYPLGVHALPLAVFFHSPLLGNLHRREPQENHRGTGENQRTVNPDIPYEFFTVKSFAVLSLSSGRL